MKRAPADHGPSGALATVPLANGGPACPAPLTDDERVQLGHGSGGKMSARLLRDRFLPHFDHEALRSLSDAATIQLGGEPIAISTDTFVVNPLEFPGGDIGALAVHGTTNDLAMVGAVPRFLSAGFILEEGLRLDVLDRVVRSMADAARRADVALVTGDTKVVERGKGDGIFINTTGIGTVRAGFRPRPEAALPGDVVLTSGPIGRHGIAIMAVREGIEFSTTLQSDSAALFPLVERLRERAGEHVHALRDPTRGGVASALNEIAAAAGIGVVLEEQRLPVPVEVASACEMLGLDPLYVANEGIFVAFVAEHAAAAALDALRSHPLGTGAAIIGRTVREHPGMVVLRTGIGGTRIVDMLPGDQLPRIC